MRFVPLLLALLALPCRAEDSSWPGLRAEIRGADAVFRMGITRRDQAKDSQVLELEVSVERVFKGDGFKKGESVKMVHLEDDYQRRLEDELNCEACRSAEGLPLFARLPAPGGSCIGLARKVKGTWTLTAFFLAEPAGGLSFEDAEQAKAYGEERRRAAAQADALVERCVRAASAPDAEAAVETGLSLCAFFTPGGAGDASLALNALLDDWTRLEKALPPDDATLGKAVSEALAAWLDGKVDDVVEARRLRGWLLGRLGEAERRRAMKRLLTEFETVRRELAEIDKRSRERDPKRRPDAAQSERDMRRKQLIGPEHRMLSELILEALGTEKEFENVDDLLEAAEAFAGSEK